MRCSECFCLAQSTTRHNSKDRCWLLACLVLICHWSEPLVAVQRALQHFLRYAPWAAAAAKDRQLGGDNRLPRLAVARLATVLQQQRAGFALAPAHHSARR